MEIIYIGIIIIVALGVLSLYLISKLKEANDRYDNCYYCYKHAGTHNMILIKERNKALQEAKFWKQKTRDNISHNNKKLDAETDQIIAQFKKDIETVKQAKVAADFEKIREKLGVTNIK